MTDRRASRDRRHRGRVPCVPKQDDRIRRYDEVDRILLGEMARMEHERRMKEIREMDIPEDVLGDAAPLTFDYTNREPGFDPDAMIDAEDLATDMAAEAGRNMKERLDYELRGAWRAGYDYVHVYDEVPSRDEVGRGRWTLTQYVFPAYSENPPDPDGLVYAYTYDLTSVPDHVMRAAARGELDKYERINTDR